MINLKDISVNNSGGKLGPVPEGRYTVLVEEAKLGLSTKGNEKISLTLSILDEGPYKGRKLWSELTITQKSLPFLKYFLIAVGSKLADSDSVNLKDIAIDVKNKKCTAYAEEGVTNNGTPRNEVGQFKPIPIDPLTSVPEVGGVSPAPEVKKPLFK